MKESNTSALQCSITPDTVYISSNSNQSSYANFTITIKNNGSDAVNIQSISITLPDGLARANALQSIVMKAAQPDIWSFKSSMINVGEFDAAPKSGSSVTMKAGDTFNFILDTVTLVNVIGSTPQYVPVSFIFSDGSKSSQDLPVNLEVANAKIDFLNATLSNIVPGQSSTLSWQCAGINYCIIQPGDGSKLPTSYSLDVSPASTTIYTLYAYGDGVILSTQYGITVDNPQIVSFGVVEGETIVPLGGSVTLNWVCNEFTKHASITSSTSIVIPLDLPAQKGSVTLGPVNAPTTFTLYAYAEDRSHFTTWVAYIGIANLTAELSSSPSTGMWAQDTVALSWNIANATSLSLTPAVANGPSLQNLSGTANYAPAAGITGVTFTLSATGFVNEALQTININLPLNFQAVTIMQFTTLPPVIMPGITEMTLKWLAQAPYADLNGQSVNTNDILVVSPPPPNGTVYTLSAGTGQHPGMVSQQIKIMNVTGPYAFNSFYYIRQWTDPLDVQLVIPSQDLVPMLPYIGGGQISIVFTGLSVAGQPYTAAINAHVNQSQYGIGFIIDFVIPFNLAFDWTDPQNPSGTVTIVST